MATLRVSLDVVVDDADESRCGEKCPHLTVARIAEPGIKNYCFRFLHLAGHRQRNRACLDAQALAAADDAVLSFLAEHSENLAHAVSFRSWREGRPGSPTPQETEDALDEARRKLRATKGRNGR